jgi:hypothetical protein
MNGRQNLVIVGAVEGPLIDETDVFRAFLAAFLTDLSEVFSDPESVLE